MEKNKTVRILILDDEPVIVSVVKTLITSIYPGDQSQTTGVESIAAAKLLGLENFDIVICDMTLRGESGCDLLTHMRQDLGLETPFLLMTGRSLEEIESVTKGLGNLGNFQILTKPLKSIRTLHETIEKALHSSP